MSSPAFYSEGPRSPYEHGSGQAEHVQNVVSDIPTHLMRVKVLYTFDDQNKTNCLARLPHELQIPTVALDETTHIGVIELRTCIQAIVAASPELVAKLGRDYTVYAYDYSEYETPLVGQGMLSRVLASASSTPMVPAHQSKTMITGRVCKNILGLFSNGAKETLEVKLRLVPVPTCMQNEYVQSMERNRSLNKSMLFEGFDQGGIASPGQHNDNLQPEIAEDSGVSGKFRNDSGDVESLQNLLLGGGVMDNSLSNFNMQQDGLEMASPEFHDKSRKASPAPSNHSQHINAQQGDIEAPSRPLSSCSLPSNAIGPNMYGADGSLSGSFEDGPARKRACLTKAQWRGRGSFGYNHESLRVTASSAASIRVHRPVPKRHSTSLSDVEVNVSGFRPPTPRPNEKRFSLDRDRLANRSTLRQMSSFSGAIEDTPANAGNTHQYHNHHQALSASYADPGHAFAESRPSPESVAENSPEGTMTDIPSSPPVLAHPTISPAPSSPQLPSLPKFTDSGYMSSNFERDNEDEKPVPKPIPPTYPTFANNGREPRSANSGVVQRLGGKGRAREEPPSTSCTFLEETPGPPELLPTAILPRNPNYRPPRYHSPQLGNYEEKNVPSAHGGPQGSLNRRRSKAATASINSDSPVNLLPTSSPTMTKAEVAKPPISAITLPPNPPPSSHQNPIELFRSASGASAKDWPSENPDKLNAEDSDARSGKQRSGSGAKRRKAIEKRLAESIAGGTMPPYCMNCGAIETPTWRRAVGRMVQGSPRNLKLTDADGEILTCEILERSEDGEVTKFRAISKYIGQDNRSEAKMLLFCNPCGLYLNKMKCMRPPEKWAKPSAPATKRRGPYKRRKGKNGEAEPQSDIMTDAPQEAQGQTSPAREQDEPSNDRAIQQLPPRKRQRASSVEPRVHSAADESQWNGPAAAAAFRRAIQSSPPRLAGTANTPIEIDAELTPKPTRRLLFPSPRRQGEMKSLDDRDKSKASQNENSGPPRAGSNLEEVIYNNTNNGPNDDKENCPPPSQLSIDQDDELAELFTDNAPGFQMSTTATTTNNATPSRHRSSSLLFDPLKTPKSRNSSTKLNSSSHKKHTPLGTSSSISKHAIARRHSIELSTPSRSAKRQQQQQQQQLYGTGSGNASAVTASMTPLTASLYQIFSSTAGGGDDDDDNGDINGNNYDVNPDINTNVNPMLHPWATSPSQPFDFPDACLNSNFDFPSADITPTSRRFANILNMNMNMNLGMGTGMDLNVDSEPNENYNDGDIFAPADDEFLYGAGLSLSSIPNLSHGIDLDATAAPIVTGAGDGEVESPSLSVPSVAGLFSLYEDPVGEDGDCCDGGGGGGGEKILGIAMDEFTGDGHGHGDCGNRSLSNSGNDKGREDMAAATATAAATAAITTTTTPTPAPASAPATSVTVKEEQFG